MLTANFLTREFSAMRGEEGPSNVVIEKRRIMPGQLSTLGKIEERLRGKLSERSIHDPSQVFCADYHDSKLWVYRY